MTPLKCLAITNSYPPDHAGGYELGTGLLLGALARNAGWDNTVLSAVRKAKPQGTHLPQLTGYFPGVLGPEFAYQSTKRSLVANHERIVRELGDRVRDTDVIVIFNPRRLILPQWASVFRLEKPTFLFVSDFWLQNPLDSDLFLKKCPKLADGRLKDERLRTLYEPVVDGLTIGTGVRGALFVSQFLKTTHDDYLPEVKNRTVTHWGVETEAFRPTPFTPDRLKTWGFCGRPDENKGLDKALSAFAAVAGKVNGLCMLVACDLNRNAYGRSIRKMIRGDSVLKKSVVQMGHINHDELYDRFFSKIGILLFPSTWQEPFSLTVLEAMASGVLVVASSTGGTPEVVDESTGYLFDPHQDGDLEAQCIAALNAGRENRRRVESGINRILETHTIDRMAAGVDCFIRGLL